MSILAFTIIFVLYVTKTVYVAIEFQQYLLIRTHINQIETKSLLETWKVRKGTKLQCFLHFGVCILRHQLH